MTTIYKQWNNLQESIKTTNWSFMYH